MGLKEIIKNLIKEFKKEFSPVPRDEKGNEIFDNEK